LWPPREKNGPTRKVKKVKIAKGFKWGGGGGMNTPGDPVKVINAVKKGERKEKKKNANGYHNERMDPESSLTQKNEGLEALHKKKGELGFYTNHVRVGRGPKETKEKIKHHWGRYA